MWQEQIEPRKHYGVKLGPFALIILTAGNTKDRATLPVPGPWGAQIGSGVTTALWSWPCWAKLRMGLWAPGRIPRGLASQISQLARSFKLPIFFRVPLIVVRQGWASLLLCGEWQCRTMSPTVCHWSHVAVELLRCLCGLRHASMKYMPASKEHKASW